MLTSSKCNKNTQGIIQLRICKKINRGTLLIQAPNKTSSTNSRKEKEGRKKKNDSRQVKREENKWSYGVFCGGRHVEPLLIMGSNLSFKLD